MHYKKVDEYRFSAPSEYKAYLAFKDRLKEIGAKFHEESSGMHIYIRIYTHGDFDVDDKCDVLELVNEK